MEVEGSFLILEHGF